MEHEIDTTNRYLVSARGRDKIAIMLPATVMTREEALIHAAWIVALADDSPGATRFAAILREIQST